MSKLYLTAQISSDNENMALVTRKWKFDTCLFTPTFYDFFYSQRTFFSVGLTYYICYQYFSMFCGCINDFLSILDFQLHLPRHNCGVNLVPAYDMGCNKKIIETRISIRRHQ